MELVVVLGLLANDWWW